MEPQDGGHEETAGGFLGRIETEEQKRLGWLWNHAMGYIAYND